MAKPEHLSELDYWRHELEKLINSYLQETRGIIIRGSQAFGNYEVRSGYGKEEKTFKKTPSYHVALDFALRMSPENEYKSGETDENRRSG